MEIKIGGIYRVLVSIIKLDPISNSVTDLMDTKIIPIRVQSFPRSSSLSQTEEWVEILSENGYIYWLRASYFDRDIRLITGVFDPGENAIKPPSP